MPPPQTLPLDLLRCPISGGALRRDGERLLGPGGQAYTVTPDGLPLFAETFLSEEARVQERHYDTVAAAYMENLTYPHTREYMAFLDRVFLDMVGDRPLGDTAELCCGRGEALMLVGDRVARGVGVDISAAMLRSARAEHTAPRLSFVQGDATRLPLASDSFDSVFMLGGIHHVNDRAVLFAEVARILKPGGMFYFREPVSDFFLWRWLRAVIYRLSPALDHETERPLRAAETLPVLEAAGLTRRHWSTHGFLGFCLFMNSDVLIVNRWLRFLPGITAVTRASTHLDEALTSLPLLRDAGLQVIGAAEKTEMPR